LAFKAFVSSLPQRVADNIEAHLPNAPEICQCNYIASKLSYLSDKIGGTLNLKLLKSKSSSQESLLGQNSNGSYSASKIED